MTLTEAHSFSNGKWFVNVTTVGEMIDELSRLPRDLNVTQGFADSADLIVFNRNSPVPHLSVEDGGDWTGSEEGEES